MGRQKYSPNNCYNAERRFNWISGHCNDVLFLGYLKFHNTLQTAINTHCHSAIKIISLSCRYLTYHTIVISKAIYCYEHIAQKSLTLNASKLQQSVAQQHIIKCVRM